MSSVLPFLLRHGYLVLFAFVLAEQLGLPLPAVPVLLAAGALAGMNMLGIVPSLLLALAACLLADFAWYEAGRRRGAAVLQLLCRISLEPDSCVRRTQDVFTRHGGRTLLVAKFVPGLSTVTPPLAGIFGMRPARFALLDGLGSLLWAGSFLLLGFAFSDQLEEAARQAARLGGGLAVLLGTALGAYIAWKYTLRRRFLRELRLARITPEELKQRMDAGEDVVVVDLRHSLDFAAAPYTIPGALRVAPEELENGHAELPQDREVVLYCT